MICDRVRLSLRTLRPQFRRMAVHSTILLIVVVLFALTAVFGLIARFLPYWSPALLMTVILLPRLFCSWQQHIRRAQRMMAAEGIKGGLPRAVGWAIGNGDLGIRTGYVIIVLLALSLLTTLFIMWESGDGFELFSRLLFCWFVIDLAARLFLHSHMGVARTLPMRSLALRQKRLLGAAAAILAVALGWLFGAFPGEPPSWNDLIFLMFATNLAVAVFALILGTMQDTRWYARHRHLRLLLCNRHIADPLRVAVPAR